MLQKDVLITDFVHPDLLKGLQQLGYTTTYAPEMHRHEMHAAIGSYKGVVINTRCNIDIDTLNQAPALQWIARLGSGLDIIDLDAAKTHDVAVISAPEGNAQAVAEHAMGMLLSLTRKLSSADESVRAGEWLREKHRGFELEGKTIGIIGFGNNGSAFGRLWQGWNVTVLAYDKYLDAYGSEYVKAVDLPTLMGRSDVISLHIPLTTETRNMVNSTFINSCKQGFILINTSRGINVNLRDLSGGLASGHIGGACLDVFPNEPPTSGDEEHRKYFEQIAAMDNVVLSPHIAGWTVESKKKIAGVLLKKIAALPTS